MGTKTINRYPDMDGPIVEFRSANEFCVLEAIDVISRSIKGVPQGYEPLNDSQIAYMAMWLEWRIGYGWQDVHRGVSELTNYDDAIISLAIATLQMAKWYLSSVNFTHDRFEMK